MSEPITRSIIVKADLGRVFNAWADFENFPKFMANIVSVTKEGDRLSHWVAQGPLGTSAEWDAETTLFEPNRRIAWNSRDSGTLENSVKTSGQVLFTDLSPEETEVTVTLKYEPPPGVASQIAALFEHLDRRLEEDLRRFKRYLETGATQPLPGLSSAR